MKIQGLQKMTLLDFPGRVACTVFLGGCDFRCPFCHNYELLDGTAPAVMDDGVMIYFQIAAGSSEWQTLTRFSKMPKDKPVSGFGGLPL